MTTDAENLDAEERISPVLLRLIEEVRQELAEAPAAFNAYNRTHNRHNRSFHPTPRPIPLPPPKPSTPEEKP